MTEQDIAQWFTGPFIAAFKVVEGEWAAIHAVEEVDGEIDRADVDGDAWDAVRERLALFQTLSMTYGAACTELAQLRLELTSRQQGVDAHADKIADLVAEEDRQRLDLNPGELVDFGIDVWREELQRKQAGLERQNARVPGLIARIEALYGEALALVGSSEQ